MDGYRTDCLKQLRRGETLVIVAYARLTGSELNVIENIRDLGNHGMRLKALTEPVDVI